MISCVVLDIEGTTSPTEYVTATMFPYARKRLATFIAEHRHVGRVADLVDDVRAAIAEPDASDARVVECLEAWTDADVKATPLKTIQGWIWQEGFASGELRAPFFADVIPALRRWHGAGIRLVVYSSGSVDAQRAWFANTAEGSLTDLIEAHFDTANAGPKRAAQSYERIESALALPGDALLFLSDVAAELDAARAQRWQTTCVLRPGEPAFSAGAGDHRCITTFAELDPIV